MFGTSRGCKNRLAFLFRKHRWQSFRFFNDRELQGLGIHLKQSKPESKGKNRMFKKAYRKIVMHCQTIQIGIDFLNRYRMWHTPEM
jgi:hypothetical protein